MQTTRNSEGPRIVVITGANEGIGSHMLTSLVEAAYRVAGLDTNGEHSRSLTETPGRAAERKMGELRQRFLERASP